MSDDVFTVAAANLVKDSRKAKPAKGTNEDTGYFYKPGEKVKASDLGNVDALIASGAIVPAEKVADKKGDA